MLRVENNYSVVGGVTKASSLVVAEVYKDKAARTANPLDVITYHGVEASGVITTTLDGYDKLAADLGVPNVEA